MGEKLSPRERNAAKPIPASFCQRSGGETLTKGYHGFRSQPSHLAVVVTTAMINVTTTINIY